MEIASGELCRYWRRHSCPRPSWILNPHLELISEEGVTAARVNHRLHTDAHFFLAHAELVGVLEKQQVEAVCDSTRCCGTVSIYGLDSPAETGAN